jgi:hypothetical protein
MPRTFVERYTKPPVNACKSNPLCINMGNVPLLKNVRTGLIDPTTPQSAMTRKSYLGKKQTLVVSLLRLFRDRTK